MSRQVIFLIGNCRQTLKMLLISTYYNLLHPIHIRKGPAKNKRLENSIEYKWKIGVPFWSNTSGTNADTTASVPFMTGSRSEKLKISPCKTLGFSGDLTSALISYPETIAC